MARKIKIPNERQKRYKQEEQRRKIDVRTKRQYYLIVCEGERTEPNYFQGMKDDLPRGVLEAYQINIQGTGYNTQSLIDRALELKKRYEQENSRPIDRLWVVFDKDSFSAIDFNNAILRCQQAGIGCGWSNEAFELWYLLHFHYYSHRMSRKDYQDAIEENLKPHEGDSFRYQKNSTKIYALLKEHGSVNDAIRYAKRLAKEYSDRYDYANHNPCTMVWQLVEELMKLK